MLQSQTFSRSSLRAGSRHAARRSVRRQASSAYSSLDAPAKSQKQAPPKPERAEEDFDKSQIPDSLPVGFSDSIAEEFETLQPASTDRPADAASDSQIRDDTFLGVPAHVRGMLLLNLGAMLFGSNQVVIKTAEDVLSPVALNALRFGMAAICFAPLLPRALRQPSMLKPSLELGAWLTAGYTAQAFGLAMTSASHGAFTGTFTVLAVPMLSGLTGRKIAWKTWAAAAAALLGVSMLTTSGGEPNLGDAVCILSAVLFGVHKWRSESVTAQVPDTTALVALQLTVLAGCSALLAGPEAASTVADAFGSGGGGIPAILDSAASLPWLEIAFMGVGTTALTLWIEMNSLKDVSATLAALIYSAEPLWGAAFAWVLLGDRWGAQGWVGAALIIGSSIASQVGGDPAQRAQLSDASAAAAEGSAAKEKAS